MLLRNQVDGRAGFDQHQNARGLFGGGEKIDGHFCAVVKDLKIFLAQIGYEFTARVGDGGGDADEINADADGGRFLHSGRTSEARREHNGQQPTDRMGVSPHGKTIALGSPFLAAGKISVCLQSRSFIPLRGIQHDVRRA